MQMVMRFVDLLIAVVIFALVVAIRFGPVIEELRDPATPRFGSKAWHWPAVVLCVIGLVILVLLRIYAT
jgi:hypothetical protein